MTAGNMRANGVRNLLVSCADCYDEALLNADHMPADVEIHSPRRPPKVLALRIEELQPHAELAGRANATLQLPLGPE